MPPVRPAALTLALATALVCAASAGSAKAQDDGDRYRPAGGASVLDPRAATTPAPQAPTAAAEPAGPAGATPDADAPIDFEADSVGYDDTGNTVTAHGNVVLRRGTQSARAETITWNRETGKILATGDVRLVDENGNVLFTEKAELTDELQTGAMGDLLLALRQGGRLAATSGQRNAAGEVILDQASYTACQIEDADGCPKQPSWRVTAARVVYQPDRGRVTFRRARLEIFGVARLPLPGLALNTNGQPSSGLLVPTFRSSKSNGFELNGSYYWRITPERDLTIDGYVFTEAPPMVSGQYRALTGSGAYQITGYATTSRSVGVVGTAPDTDHGLRGYVFANGRLQLSPEWSITGSIRRASDRTFLRRYYISDDDRLRSTVSAERIDADSYLSIAGWATQTLRVDAVQSQIPLALPEIDYRRRLRNPLLGGRIELQANTLALTRSDGQDTQRAFASAQWELRRITGMGQQVTLTGLVRGDVYHSSGNDLTASVDDRGEPGWQTRAVALAAIDVMWPFVGPAWGGTQVLTPRVQIVAAPPIRNFAIPNEDSRAIDLEDSNLFALNRFPGYDRVEDGTRVTYGLDYSLDRPNWRLSGTIGQSYRLTSGATLAPDGTGLASQTSDIVGRSSVRYRDFLEFTNRFRLDKDTLAVRRNEFDAAIGGHQTYLEIGYTRLNRNIVQTLEDLQDREELRAAARIAFAKYWSLFGSALINLTDQEEDPAAGTDGFQPLRSRFGFSYSDDCIEIGLTWRRNFVTTGDARKGDVFQLRFALKNLGFR